MQKKKKEALPREIRSQDTLIEKSQVNHPKLDQDMEKILNSIVQSIRNCPPAQPRRKYQKLSDYESKMKLHAKPISHSSFTPPTSCFGASNDITVNSTTSGDSEDKKSILSFDRASLSFLEEESKAETPLLTMKDKNEEPPKSLSKQDKSDDNLSEKKPASESPTTKSQPNQKQQSATVIINQQKNNSKNQRRRELTTPQPIKKHIGEGMVARPLRKLQVIDLDSAEIAEKPNPEVNDKQIIPPAEGR